MLRINLLPAYVQQRRLTKALVPIFIFIFALCVAAPLAAYFYLHGKLTTLTQDAADAVTGKGKTDALKAEAVTTLAQVAPIQSKLQFLKDDYSYIGKWVQLYSTLANTTPKSSFIYTGAQVTGPTMAIKAYSPSVEEVGRYLQVMYHEPDFSTVAVDHIPAYPDNVRHLYYLNGTLVFADGASGGGTTQGGFGGGSSSGYPGRGGPSISERGGYPGGGQGGGQVATGAPANWTPDALGPNGPTNVPPDVGPPPPEIAVGGTTSAAGQGGGQNGGGYSQRFLEIAGRGISPFASPAVRDAILAKALRHVVHVTVAKGFDINVTATLKEPLTPPDLPGSAPAAGAGAGGPLSAPIRPVGPPPGAGSNSRAVSS